MLRQCGVCWPPGCPPLLAAAEALVPDVGGAALCPRHFHRAAHCLAVQHTHTLPNLEGSGSNVKVKSSHHSFHDMQKVFNILMLI